MSEDRQGEAQAVRAFVQGSLAATCGTGLGGNLAVDHVEQDVDADGAYLPYFTVVTASGLRVRVDVTAPPPDAA